MGGSTIKSAKTLPSPVRNSAKSHVMPALTPLLKVPKPFHQARGLCISATLLTTLRHDVKSSGIDLMCQHRHAFLLPNAPYRLAHDTRTITVTEVTWFKFGGEMTVLRAKNAMNMQHKAKKGKNRSCHLSSSPWAPTSPRRRILLTALPWVQQGMDTAPRSMRINIPGDVDATHEDLARKHTTDRGYEDP